MKLSDLKKEIQKYQYFEDTNIIDVSIAAIVATRLKLGDPIWLILIGPSSGGKSQILRPLALTDTKFLHRIDDLTENTLLSGMVGGEKSLLKRIGSLGMLVISDFTVIFSKSSETRGTILSQFRMIYDGEMTKFSGNSEKPITWKGHLGVIAGSTPSIYANFEEVSDMGERFIYYRMKPYDTEEAMKVSMNRNLYGAELDEMLGTLYESYIKEVVLKQRDMLGSIVLKDNVKDRIYKVASFAEKIRATQHIDWKGAATRIPVPAMPMRVALQLTTIAKSLAVIRNHESNTYELSENDIKTIEWCGYSLANEEKRAILKILANQEFDWGLTTQTIADQLGLSTERTQIIVQNLSAVGVLKRSAEMNQLKWKMNKLEDYNFIRFIEDIDQVETIENREVTSEEGKSQSEAADRLFEENF